MNFVHIRLHEGDKRAHRENSFLTQGIITAKRFSARVIVPALRAVASVLTPTVFTISLVSATTTTTIRNADAQTQPSKAVHGSVDIVEAARRARAEGSNARQDSVDIVDAARKKRLAEITARENSKDYYAVGMMAAGIYTDPEFEGHRDENDKNKAIEMAKKMDNAGLADQANDIYTKLSLTEKEIADIRSGLSAEATANDRTTVASATGESRGTRTSARDFRRRLRELDEPAAKGETKTEEVSEGRKIELLRSGADLTNERKKELLKQALDELPENAVAFKSRDSILRVQRILNILIELGEIKPKRIKGLALTGRNDRKTRAVTKLWQEKLRAYFLARRITEEIKSRDEKKKGIDGVYGTSTNIATHQWFEFELGEKETMIPTATDLGPELAAKDKKIKGLEDEVAALTDKLNKCEDQLKTCGTTDEANQLRQEVERLKTELQSCQDNLTACQATAGNEDLQRKVTELEEKVRTLEEEVARLNRELTDRQRLPTSGKPADLNPPTSIAVRAYRDGHPSTYLTLGGSYDRLKLELPTLDGHSTQWIDQQTVDAFLAVPLWRTLAIVGAYSNTIDRLELMLGNDNLATEVRKQFVGGGLRGILSSNKVGTAALEVVLGASFDKEFPVIVNGTRLSAKAEASPDGVFKLVLNSRGGKTFLAGKLSTIGYNPSEAGIEDRHMPSLPWLSEDVTNILSLNFQTELVLMQQVPNGIVAPYDEQKDGRMYLVQGNFRVPIIGNKDYNLATLFGGNYQAIVDPTDNRMSGRGIEIGGELFLDVFGISCVHNWGYGSLGKNEFILSAGVDLGGVFAGSSDLSGLGGSNLRHRINGALVVPRE